MPQEVQTISGDRIFSTAARRLVRTDEAHLIGRWFCRVRVWPHVYINEAEPGDSEYPANNLTWLTDDLERKTEEE